MPESSIREAVQGAVKEEETPADQQTDKQPAPEKKDEGRETPAREEAAKGLTEHDKQLLRGGGLSEEAFSELPKQQQDAALKLFRSYDKGFHKDRAEVAELKRLKDTFEEHPELETDVREVIQKRLSGGKLTKADEATIKEASPSAAKTLKGFDRLIDKATDPEVRENLRETKRVLLEEMQDSINSATKELRDEVNALKGNTTSTNRQKAVQSVDRLENEFGYPASLVEKYRKDLVTYGSKYPQMNIEDVLFKIVPATEMKAVLQPKKEPSRRVPPRPDPVSGKSDEGTNELDDKRFKQPGKSGGWKIGHIMRHALKKEGVL